MGLDQVLYDLVRPMVDEPESLEVRQLNDSSEREIVLCVYAKDDDIARLIGRRGMMASALRQVMAVASHAEGKRISIKFEKI